jgi:hypothetical protein
MFTSQRIVYNLISNFFQYIQTYSIRHYVYKSILKTFRAQIGIKDWKHFILWSLYNTRYKSNADPGGRAAWGVCLQPLASWECGFEFRLGAWIFFSCDCCMLSSRVCRADRSSKGVIPNVVWPICMIAPLRKAMTRKRFEAPQEKTYKINITGMSFTVLKWQNDWKFGMTMK